MNDFYSLPAGDQRVIATQAGEYIIYNMSPFYALDIHGGKNSTLQVALGPSSYVKVWCDGELTVQAPENGTVQFTFVHLKEWAPSIPPVTPSTSKLLQGMKFFLDAGHGGKDPGAVNTLFNLAEKDAALAIILALGSLLELQDADVDYSRDDDTFIGLTNRANMANAMGANAFISVHLNAAENTSAIGTEVLVYKTKSIAGDLAQHVLGCIVKDLGMKNRGVKERSDLTVLSKTKMPAILVETGFISNNEEAQQLFDPDIQWGFAKAIYEGILNQFVPGK